MNNEIRVLIIKFIREHLSALSILTPFQRSEISKTDSINIIWGQLLAEYRHLIIMPGMVREVWEEVISNEYPSN